MNIQSSIGQIDRHILNNKIKKQSEKWDVERHFLEFEQALDTLDLITDGLPDDPKISNALNALHSNFSEIYLTSKSKLLAQ